MTMKEIKDNMMLGVRPATGNGKPFLDLEVYLYVRVPNTGIVNVTSDMLKIIGMEDYDAFEIAKKNTKAQLKARTMSELFFEEFGETLPQTPVDLIVVNTEGGYLGAAALCFPEFLKETCKRYGLKKVQIAPSSIHELIITEVIDGTDSMVNDVNMAEVKPEERLADHWYYFDVDTMEITY